MGDVNYQRAKTRLEEEAARFRECPHCKERMRSDATVCPPCQRDVERLIESAEPAEQT
jgi:hypothetical protein